MKRLTHYGLGLFVLAVIAALYFARERLFDFVFGHLPNWAAMTLIFGLIIVTLVLVAREQSKKKPEPSPFCKKCGYDLRATPTRCPECGTIAPGGKA